MTYEKVFEKYSFVWKNDPGEEVDGEWLRGDPGSTPYHYVVFWESNGLVIREYKTTDKSVGAFILRNRWDGLEIDTPEKLGTLLELLFPLERVTKNIDVHEELSNLELNLELGTEPFCECCGHLPPYYPILSWQQTGVGWCLTCCETGALDCNLSQDLVNAVRYESNTAALIYHEAEIKRIKRILNKNQ